MSAEESKVSEWAEQLRERDRVREEGGTTGIDDAVLIHNNLGFWRAQEARSKREAAS